MGIRRDFAYQERRYVVYYIGSFINTMTDEIYPGVYSIWSYYLPGIEDQVRRKPHPYITRFLSLLNSVCPHYLQIPCQHHQK